MSSGLELKRLLYRDGTGQSQRLLEALNPDYIPVDERGIGDLLRFAQELAGEINFFNENNEPKENWVAFLIDDFATFENRPEEEQAIRKKKWIEEVLSFIENPEKFSSDSEKYRKLSRPHLILFVAFLELLGHVRKQLNGLTKRHLDFYYLEVLRLSKKKPVPDVVNVIAELASDVREFLLEKGTHLFAGKDSLGKDLTYLLDRDTIVSQARLAEIRTLFVDKKITDVRKAHAENFSDANKGLQKMMELALGDPLPGNKLPKFGVVEVGAAGLENIYNNLKEANEIKVKVYRDYVSQKLFLTVADFNRIIEKSKNADLQDTKWEQIYILLEEAYKKKVKATRQKLLEEKRMVGFMNMFQFALGDPGNKYELPSFKGNEVTLSKLNVINGELSDPKLRAEALNYVKDELLLSESDFKFIIDTNNKPVASSDEWARVFAILEPAQRTKQNLVLGSPFTEQFLNVFSIRDSRARAFTLDAEEGDASLRFNTFGKGHTNRQLFSGEPANIGFAVSSPQLLLKEGARTITLTLGFTEDHPLRTNEVLSSLAELPEGSQPFSFLLSSEKGWINVVAEKVSYGTFVPGPSGKILIGVRINDQAQTITGTGLFSKADEGKYVMSKAGELYQIKTLIDANGVNVVKLETLDVELDFIRKYDVAEVYFNAMQIKLSLKESDPPVTAPFVEHPLIKIKSGNPVLGMLLNHFPQKVDSNVSLISLYQQFKDLQLEKLKVQVSVDNIRSLQLQNDFSVLNYKKPFEPFGYSPQSGNSLYFSHPELAIKQLDEVRLQMEWMNPPADFRTHYDNYETIARYPGTQPVTGITSNSVFTGSLKLVDNNTIITLGSIQLFKLKEANNEGAKMINPVTVSVSKNISQTLPSFGYLRNETAEQNNEVLDGSRYFALELGKPDFQHGIYPGLLTKQAMLVVNNSDPHDPVPGLRALLLNPPYTPKLKSLTTGYAASFEMVFGAGTAEKGDRIFHVNAFGYNDISHEAGVTKKSWFLPYFSNEGELYLGFEKLQVPQTLSVLFQMAEGSGNPDIAPPKVEWSYLSNNSWYHLDESRILSDTTSGLLNTGIIVFNLPEKMTSGDSLINPRLHWLKASVLNNSASISDTVDVFAQGISATFADNGNAEDHLLNPLPSGSIKRTVSSFAAIRKIIQPYTSSKGKPAEVDRLFYNRASERLRHKNRALTMWDYERLVLEQFPEIYKVKCIPADFTGNPSDAGSVNVIVVPDIRSRLPFNPFEPKAPADTIQRIQKFLERRIPAFASVQVKNPSYLQVKTRFGVKFRVGYNETFYKRKLEEELKKYLAPWAYDEGADIVLGGRIYDIAIVNFLAERHYVEYVAGIKLFQSKDGLNFSDVRSLNPDGNYVQASSPDVILVSAFEHEIDIISEKGFEDEDFTGIGYMQIELDFKVG